MAKIGIWINLSLKLVGSICFSSKILIMNRVQDII